MRLARRLTTLALLLCSAAAAAQAQTAAAQGRGAQVPHLRSAAAAAQSLDFARQFFTRTLAAP